MLDNQLTNKSQAFTPAQWWGRSAGSKPARPVGNDCKRRNGKCQPNSSRPPVRERGDRNQNFGGQRIMRRSRKLVQVAAKVAAVVLDNRLGRNQLPATSFHVALAHHRNRHGALPTQAAGIALHREAHRGSEHQHRQQQADNATEQRGPLHFKHKDKADGLRSRSL